MSTLGRDGIPAAGGFSYNETFMRWKQFVGWMCLALVAACSRDSQPTEKPAPQKQHIAGKELVVISTNDFHAALDKAEGLASTLGDLRKRYGDHMIYLDAGDLFQGSIEGSISKGKAVIAFYNLLHPDAVAIGNHEFDYGPNTPARVTVRRGEDGMGNIKQRVKEAKFPMLSANLVLDPPVSCRPGPNCNALGQETVFQPRAVIQRGGNRVCVIGVTTPLTANITSPSFLTGSKFLDLKQLVEAESAWMKNNERCDWVLLLAHEGLYYEPGSETLKRRGLLSMLQELKPSTVDAVIAGHSHTPMQQQIRGVPVIQTGKSAKYVGILHLYQPGSNKTFRFEKLMPVPDRGVAFDVTRELMFYRQQSFAYKKHIVGSAGEAFLFDKTKETALGNLITDAVRESVKADCALINAGAIRNNLPLGPVTVDSVFRIMPFDDTLVVVDLTGSELRNLVEVGCSGALGLCSVSGLQIQRLDPASGSQDRDLNLDGRKDEWERNVIVDIKDARGNPLQDNRTYRLATSSYLVEGGDFQSIVYDQVPQSRIHYHVDTLIRTVLQDYFQKHSPLHPRQYLSASKPRIVNVIK